MQEPLTSGSFGESQFGQRLSYKDTPKYRDLCWAVLYLVHVTAVIGSGAWLWLSQYPSMHDSDNDTNPQISFNVSGVVVGVLCLWHLLAPNYEKIRKFYH